MLCNFCINFLLIILVLSGGSREKEIDTSYPHILDSQAGLRHGTDPRRVLQDGIGSPLQERLSDGPKQLQVHPSEGVVAKVTGNVYPCQNRQDF